MFYIFTRLGIGVRKPDFYRDHIKLASLTVSRSLRAQTDKTFTWIVVIDARAPEWVESAINALGVTNHQVWRLDPLEVGMNPSSSILTWLKERGNGCVARVDDDDLIHRNFVKMARAELDGRNSSAMLTFPNGINLTAERATRRNYPWIALGLTSYSMDLDFTCFSHQHNKIMSKLKSNADPVIINTDSPMWIRTWRLSSTSSSARGIRADGDAAYFNPKDFGLNKLSLWRLKKALASDSGEQSQSFTGHKPHTILAMKRHALALYKKAHESNDLSSAELMAQMFYRI